MISKLMEKCSSSTTNLAGSACRASGRSRRAEAMIALRFGRVMIVSPLIEPAHVHKKRPMQLNKNEGFWITGFQASELRPAPEPEGSQPGSGQVVVQALYSAISRGTESLVYNQRVPVTEHQRMRAPFQEGDFPG